MCSGRYSPGGGGGGVTGQSGPPNPVDWGDPRQTFRRRPGQVKRAEVGQTGAYEGRSLKTLYNKGERAGKCPRELSLLPAALRACLSALPRRPRREGGPRAFPERLSNSPSQGPGSPEWHFPPFVWALSSYFSSPRVTSSLYGGMLLDPPATSSQDTRLPPRASSGSQGGPRGPQGARGQSPGTGWHATARSHGDELDRPGVLHISQEPPPRSLSKGRERVLVGREGRGARRQRAWRLTPPPGRAMEQDRREGAQREAEWTGFRPCSLWGRQGPQDDFWAERPSERLVTGDSQREPGGPVSMVRWCCRAKWGGRKGSPGKMTPLYL